MSGWHQHGVRPRGSTRTGEHPVIGGAVMHVDDFEGRPGWWTNLSWRLVVVR
jgi:hypothetical protein